MSDFIWGCIGIAVLLFMFSGKPDAYDALHIKAMQPSTCEAAK